MSQSSRLGVEVASGEAKSTTGYEWTDLTTINRVGSSLSGVYPAAPNDALVVLGDQLDFPHRYPKYWDTYWVSTAAGAAENVKWSIVKPWVNDSRGFEFLAASVPCLNALRDMYSMDIPLLCWTFFYWMEYKCESPIKQNRSREVLRYFLINGVEKSDTLLRSYERGQPVTLCSQHFPYLDELYSGVGVPSLSFSSPTSEVSPTPIDSSKPATSETKVEGATAPKDDKGAEGDDEGSEDKGKRTIAAWGLLLRLGLLYVAELADGTVELAKAESAWKSVRQKKGESFEIYEVNEQQSFQVYQALRAWVELPPISDHERAVSFISHAHPSLAEAYTKILRKNLVFPATLDYIDVTHGLSELDRKLSIKYPWEVDSASGKSNRPAKATATTSTSTSSGNGAADDHKAQTTDKVSTVGKTSDSKHHGHRKPKHWCPNCQKHVRHSPSNCWKLEGSQGRDSGKAEVQPKDSSSPPRQYPFRQTAQRQEGFSYKQLNRSAVGAPASQPSATPPSSAQPESAVAGKPSFPQARLATELPPALALTGRSTVSPVGQSCTRGILLGVESDPVANNEVKIVFGAIDSLCEVTCINKQLVAKVRHTQASLTPLVLQTFNGDTVQLTDSIGLTVHIGHQYLNIEAYVSDLRGLSIGLVLGADFLEMTNASIFWSRRKLEIGCDSCQLYRLSDATRLTSSRTSLGPWLGADCKVAPDQLENYLASLDDAALQAFVSYRLENYNLPQLDFSVAYEDLPYQCKHDYGVPKNLRRGLEKTIQQAIDAGQLVEIPYSDDITISPAFGKAKGRVDDENVPVVRLLCDLRVLNQRVHLPSGLAEMCPSLDAFLGALPSGSRAYSVLDLSDAYHSVQCSAHASQHLCIKVLGRIFQFRVSPQGLAASALFFTPHLSAGLNHLFGDAWHHWLVSWIDDLLIHGSSISQVRSRDRIVRAGLTGMRKVISPKSLPPSEEVDCVGIHFDRGFYRLSDSSVAKLKSVLQTPPTSARGLKQTIGVLLYSACAFSWPVDRYADFTRCLAPLYHALPSCSSPDRFLWTRECDAALEKLSECLLNTPLKQLSYGDLLRGTFIVMSDAADTGCGACLFQTTSPIQPDDATATLLQDPSRSHLISEYHRTFSSVERRYHTWELECLGIVLAFRRWNRLWLSTCRDRAEGEVNVIFLSDSSTAISRFQSFKIAADNLCGVKLRKFLGWLEELEECRSAGIYFKHIQGELNSLSDVISRFTEQLDAQVAAKQEPSISPLAYSLTVGLTPSTVQANDDTASLPPPFRVVHLDLSEAEVVRIGHLQREDTTAFHGVRVKDIMVYADCLRTKVTCSLSPLVQRQILGWFGHSLWCLDHPAGNHDAGGSVPLLYVLSSAQVCSPSTTTTATQPRVVVLMIPPEPDATEAETSLRWKLMREAHSTVHLGVGSTQGALIRLGWWVGCLSTVKAFVMQCWCQEQSTIPSNMRSYGDIVQVSARFHTIAMDHKMLSEGIKAVTGYVAALGITDMSSGYTVFEPVSSMEPSESYSIFFRRWLVRFSCPSLIVSDLGSSFVNEVVKLSNALLGIRHKTVAVANARGNSRIERRNGALSHILRISEGQIQSPADLHHWLGLCEVMINMYYRQGSGSSCAFERVYGCSPVISGILSIAEDEDEDETVRESAERSESAWISQLQSTVRELLAEYHVWRGESNLAAQRRQQASLSQRRKLVRQSKLKAQLKEGSAVIYQGQIHHVQRLACNSSGDLLTATLSDGSVVQVSDLVLPAPNSDKSVPLLHERNQRGAFSPDDLVFYRSRNPNFSENSDVPEWLIYIGKVKSYSVSENEYQVHVYCPGDAGSRWLPLWVLPPKRGVTTTVRRTQRPAAATPKVVSIKESDVLARCDLNPSGSLGANSRAWLHAAGVAPPSSSSST